MEYFSLFEYLLSIKCYRSRLSFEANISDLYMCIYIYKENIKFITLLVIFMYSYFPHSTKFTSIEYISTYLFIFTETYHIDRYVKQKKDFFSYNII